MKISHRLVILMTTLITGLLLVAGITAGAAFAGEENSKAAQAPEGATVIISEIRADQTGTDNDEYFELSGSPSTSLTGYTYLVIGDGTGGSGVIEAVVDLTGSSIPADGIFFAAEATYTLSGTPDLVTTMNFENSDNVTHLLVSDFTGSTGDDLDTNDDGVLDVTPWTAVVDLIALIKEDNPPTTTEYHYGPPTVGPDDTFVPGHVYLCDTTWHIGAFDVIGGQDTPGTANDCSADLVNQKTGPSVALPGDLITYTVLYSNSGIVDGINTLITDTLPTGVSYQSDTSGLPCPACSVNATGVITWEVGTLSTGTQVSFTVQALISNTVAYGTLLTNTVEIASSTAEANAADNISKAVTGINELDLSITKTGNAIGFAGELYTYTIELKNTGVETATSVLVTDTLPVSTTYIGSVHNALSATPVGNQVIFDYGNLSSGAVETILLTIQVDDAVPLQTVITNVVTTTTTFAGDNLANNVDQWETTIYPLNLIHDIQGSGDASPLVGSVVGVEGIVVGDYQTGGYAGFFVQEEDGDADADPMTSEGIFVYSTAVDVQPGDVVQVVGTVTEFNNLTELSPVSNVVIQNSGVSVTPISVTLPIADLAQWEWYEGMLVYIPHPLYVTEIFTLGRFGEISLSVSDRLDNPTQVTDPGANALAQEALNDRSRVQLNDGQTGQNPDPILYPSPELSATNTLRGGDSVPNLTGVLNYAFGAYVLEPVGSIPFTHSNPRPTTPEALSGTLKVASFNVLNYFSTIDDGSDNCGPAEDQECRGADSVEEFTRQRDKIIHAMLAIDADIFGLIEIENNVNDEAVDDLVSGLNAIAGAGTYAKIDTGVIGTDAIKQAFIYKPATVTPVGDYAVLDETFDADYNDDYNRPALAQTFQEIANGESLTVIVNHLKSKGSDCDVLGDPDTGDGQGNCNLTRLAAADILLAWLATDPTSSSDPDFLIIGDLNSYAMEDPITALTVGGFTDLYNSQADSYSYVFDGEWGTLDYALANASLNAKVAGVTSWHINADEPPVLDYNVEFKSAGQVDSLYSDDPYRASDHDPIIVTFNLAPEEHLLYLPVVFNNASVVETTDAPTGVHLPSSGILIAIIGLGGGVFTLRRKQEPKAP